MNLILAHAVFAEKRGVEQVVKRSSSESWNVTGKCPEIVPGASKKQLKHFRVHHGEHENAIFI